MAGIYFTQKEFDSDKDDLFSRRLKDARGAKNIRPSILSELAGCDRNAVADYESGKRYPNGRAVRNLAIVLEVSADYLLGIDGRQAAGI